MPGMWSEDEDRTVQARADQGLSREAKAPMSIRVMTHVWAHSAAEGGALLVMLALADWSRDDGWGVWAAVPTIATKARLSDRQVQRVLVALRAMGEIELVEVGSGRRTNEYRIPVPWYDEPASEPKRVRPTVGGPLVIVGRPRRLKT